MIALIGLIPVGAAGGSGHVRGRVWPHLDALLLLVVESHQVRGFLEDGRVLHHRPVVGDAVCVHECDSASDYIAAKRGSRRVASGGECQLGDGGG